MRVSAEEQKKLVKLAQQGCKISLNKLIICNTPFYKLLAKKYSKFMPSGFEEDLLQFGLLHLVERILPKYDEGKGANWLTYSAVSMSRYMLTYKAKNYFSVEGVVTTRNGRYLFYLTRKTRDVDELLKMMKEKGFPVSREYVEKFLAVASVRSGECFERFFKGVPSDNNFDGDSLKDRKVRELINGMELSDKEKAVLENLITEKYNNVELGQQFNCSRQRMHQVEIKLRKKLKAVLVM